MRRSTHFVDVDGVIIEHLNDGSSNQWNTKYMRAICGTIARFNLWEKAGDCIVLVTARPETLRAELEAWLRKNGLFWNQLVMGITSGSRFLYNDTHPEYDTRVVVLERNEGLINLGDDNYVRCNTCSREGNTSSE